MKRILNGREFSLIKKDFGEIWNERGIRVAIILIPVLVAVVIPIAFLILTLMSPQMDGGQELAALKALLPESMKDYTEQQGIFYVALDLVLPMLFLMIPIMTGAMASSVFFAGERERKTLETLLLSPMPPQKIGRIKWISSTVIAVLITFASFFLFTLISAVGDIILEIRFFMDLSWIITVFLLSPLLAILSVLITALYSETCGKQSEAYKIASFLYFPVVLLFILQFAGFYKITEPVLLIVGAVLLIADVVMFKVCEKRFTAEKFLM